MPLTDTKIRQTKATERPQKLFDGNGLFLLITPANQRYWRLKYRFLDREKLLALGVYPTVTLAEARRGRELAREKLAAGIDPGEAKKAEKRAAKRAAFNTFEAVARGWLAEYQQTVSPDTHSNATSRMERDVFPWLGKRPIDQIEAPEILAVLKRMDTRGVRFSAHKVQSEIGRIFRYGIKEGICKYNPVRDLIGAIPAHVTKHFAALTEPAQVGELLRAFDGFSGTFVVRCALDLAPMLFARPGELRKAEWSQIDLEEAGWRYLIRKGRKSGEVPKEHLVPLPTQAVKILRELHSLTGNGRYVFPGARSRQRPMSESAINAALQRLGYNTREEVTGHGFRATARTILHEVLKQDPYVIEHQLSHKVPDLLGPAYNRTKFLKERRSMMQVWADYLDALKVGGNVIPLPRTA